MSVGRNGEDGRANQGMGRVASAKTDAIRMVGRWELGAVRLGDHGGGELGSRRGRTMQRRPVRNGDFGRSEVPRRGHGRVSSGSHFSARWPRKLLMK